MFSQFEADRKQRSPESQEPWRRAGGDDLGPGGEGEGPKRIDKGRLLDRMKRVDRDQSKRYRQRTGE